MVRAGRTGLDDVEAIVAGCIHYDCNVERRSVTSRWSTAIDRREGQYCGILKMELPFDSLHVDLMCCIIAVVEDMHLADPLPTFVSTESPEDVTFRCRA